MFQVVEDHSQQTYWTPVRVEFPGDNGRHVVKVFKAQFKRRTQDELTSINDRLADGSLDDRGLIAEVLCDWGDVIGADKVPMAFNEENLNLLLAMHPTQPTLVRTFYDSIKIAPAKN